MAIRLDEGFEYSYPHVSSSTSGKIKAAPYYSPAAEKLARRKIVIYSLITAAAIIGVVCGVYWTPNKSQASTTPKDRQVTIHGLEHKINH